MLQEFLLAGFLAIIILAIIYPDRAVGTRYRPDLRGPKGWPIIGNLLLMFEYNRGIHDRHYERHLLYGKNLTFTIPGVGRCVTCNYPEGIEYVLKTNSTNFPKGPLFHKLFWDFIGDGIFNSDGNHWKFQRRIITNLFQGKNFRDNIQVVFWDETKKLIELLRKVAETGEKIDFDNLSYRFTFDSFAKICFSADFDTSKNYQSTSEFANAFNYASVVLGERFLNPFWPITEEFTTRASRMRNACKTARDFANNIIQSRRVEISKKEKIPNDLLSLCLNAIDEDGRQLNDNELIDMILNLIVAGRDTTAQAITWMIYEIIKNPRVEVAILKEINSLLKESNQVPTYDSLHEFAYTTATFYESLRLHPSVPANFKTCLKDDVLPGGVPIYAGELVLWFSYTIGKAKEIWGEDAHEFKPERFLKGKEISKPNSYMYPMFNAGPRHCLGQQFATLETIILITSILREFKFEIFPTKNPITYENSLTLPMKYPLRVKVQKR
ncbi:hypothetical protein G9A89_011557 [Geosiphon pyriformis]|nr:hypothetical protein G9A89_011557 [Geosiphon pyriformis]